MAVIALVVAVKSPRDIFCSELINPYWKVVSYRVAIPADEIRSYNLEVGLFLRGKNIPGKVKVGRILPVDSSGGVYDNYNYTACDGRSYFWSSNILRNGEFTVTVYANYFFDAEEAVALGSEFKKRFGGKYSVVEISD